MIVFCSIYCANVFDSIFNLLKKDADCSFLFLCKTLVFYFSISTFLEFGCLNQVSPKLVYRPQISSRSAPGDKINKPFIQSLRQSLSKILITEVHRVQQTMWQELIQTDREGRNVCSDSLMVYLSLYESFLYVLKGTSYSRDTEH